MDLSQHDPPPSSPIAALALAHELLAGDLFAEERALVRQVIDRLEARQQLAAQQPTAGGPRCIALFTPQVWIGETAMELEGEEVEFDITDQVLAMGSEAALRLQDDDYATDNLWHAHPLSALHAHDGPFRIEARDAIEMFFEDAQ